MHEIGRDFQPNRKPKCRDKEPEEFATENNADQETAAKDVLAQSLIASGDYDHSAKEIEIARKLGARDLPVTLSLKITGGRLLAKIDKNTEAERELKQCEKEAAEKGLVGIGWQALLSLADAQVLGGYKQSATANLQRIRSEASLKGFRLLVRKAQESEEALRKE